jgi:peptide/nickel transport system permease protein
MSIAAPSIRTARGGSTPRLAPWRSLGLLGRIAAVVAAGAAVIAVVGPLVAPYDPDSPDITKIWVGREGGHLLGYDATGRDVLSRLFDGARTAMLGPLFVVAISVTIGVLIAVVAAWRGGRIDTFVGAGLDIAFAFPGILIAILVAAVFGAGITAAVVALSFAYTPYIARVVRGVAMQERSKPYIAALEVQGMPVFAICRRHLVPNIRGVIVAQATTLFGYAMVDLAAISFIGLGVQPPQADWGAMVNENLGGIVQGHPWPAALSGACLVIVVVSFNVLGERLMRDAAGPR